jgi:hypothetical protein
VRALVARDLAAPGSRLLSTILDEALEPVEIAGDLTVVQLGDRADLLDDGLGLPVDLDRHPRAIVGQLVERDHAGVRRPVGAIPRDPLFRILLGHLGIEGTLDSRDVDLPVQTTVVELLHLVDPAHEFRKRLELGPLVVGGPDRYLDID